MTSERVPADQTRPKPERRPAVLYYHHRGFEVTDRTVTADGHRYITAELTDLRRARGATHPGVLTGLVIAVAEGVFVAPFIGIVRTPWAWVAAALALAIPCLVGFYCARRWPAHFELLAEYRGRDVVLFACRDQLEFGRVARAVRRAVEASARLS
jgi:hypothetical protein